MGTVTTRTSTTRLTRDTMLPVLQGAVVREGRRRHVRRLAVRGAATASLILIVGIGLVNIRPTSDDRLIPGPSKDSGTVVTILRSKPGALDRYSITASMNPAKYVIDDYDLMATLSAIGRPAGLVRSRGRTWLTTPVTDAALAPPVEEPGGKDPLPFTPRTKRPS